jgi:hypothetical protein
MTSDQEAFVGFAHQGAAPDRFRCGGAAELGGNVEPALPVGLSLPLWGKHVPERRKGVP